MTLTNSQFYFLVKEKVLHKNTPITVKRTEKVRISDNYKLNKSVTYEGKLIGYLSNEQNNKFAVKYYLDSNRDKIKVSPIEDIIKIEGQQSDRYFEALKELLANKNALVINEPTNVINNVVGKEKPTLKGNELYEGMKIILKNDKTAKYNNKILNIKGYGTSVKLIANAGRPKTKEDEGPKIKKKRGRKKGYRKNAKQSQ